MAAATDTRSALGALGPTDIEQALSDPRFAEALLQALDPATCTWTSRPAGGVQHRMLAASIRLARQIYLEHLRRQPHPSDKKETPT